MCLVTELISLFNIILQNLEAESETLKSQHSLLMEEHNTLLGVHKTVQAEREQFLEQLTRVKRTATPR